MEQLQSCRDSSSEKLAEAVDAPFHRFGVLASQPWPLSVMDDQGSIESCCGTTCESSASLSSAVRLNCICIRRFVNMFLVFHRHTYLWNAKQPALGAVGAGNDIDCRIKIHHIVAASDVFNTLSMYWDLMPAAKLNYIHDFGGYSTVYRKSYTSIRRSTSEDHRYMIVSPVEFIFTHILI